MTMPHPFCCDPGRRLSLPEHRALEIASKKRTLQFAADPDGELAEARQAAARLQGAFAGLDAALGAPLPGPDAMAVWGKYLGLPKDRPTDKVMAEIYRALRIVAAALGHESGRIEVRDGLVKAAAVVERTALTLRISLAGMALLESAVVYGLEAASSPYPEAYVEAMLLRYWADITGEIHWFYDEDQRLYQFRDRLCLNRHLRFDCDLPKYGETGGLIRFQLGERYGDAGRYPLDLFAVVDERLHIIPAEALTDAALAREQLPRWRARIPDGLTLPARFRARFGREILVPGLPMI